MDWLIPVIVALGAVVVGVVAYRIGTSRGREAELQRLEEYEFYPFVVNDSRHIEFSPERFSEATRHFLKTRNSRAAGELIIIGEQNMVRSRFGTSDLDSYKELYELYDGDSVISETEEFLDNYMRIVNLIGRSFPHTGIEILLHNLVNPARSVVVIENGEVTGRSIGMGATNLVLDLKTRRYHNQDKLNYELNLGSRQFKCTTIPIYREDYGLVGAICINIDTKFLREEVAPSASKLQAFLDNFLRTDFELDENILAPDEYQAALRGKRHYLDDALRGIDSDRRSHLAAIMFSDVADFTSTMTSDEPEAMRQLELSARIHRDLISDHHGRLLKELGDGVLASFESVSQAVACAQAIQTAAREAGVKLRIGIHMGEVLASGGDVFGDGVNLAQRIHDAAEPGQIVVTEPVYANVRNKGDVPLSDLGEIELKHVEGPVRLFLIST
jgi:class 3 adenylate cyclase